ncbi:hypothetical protein [Streptomyces sp. NPDC058672]|uniref:hypothetical protein n=1 Tax=Streptomyces sp. NPDC058672 TaxID=3346591 RepID=UPI00365789E4
MIDLGPQGAKTRLEMRDPLLYTALIRPVHVLGHDVIKTGCQPREVPAKVLS